MSPKLLGSIERGERNPWSPIFLPPFNINKCWDRLTNFLKRQFCCVSRADFKSSFKFSANLMVDFLLRVHPNTRSHRAKLWYNKILRDSIYYLQDVLFLFSNKLFHIATQMWLKFSTSSLICSMKKFCQEYHNLAYQKLLRGAAAIQTTPGFVESR